MPTLFQINVAANCGSHGRIAEQIGLLAMQHGWDVWLAHGARFVQPSQLHTYQTQGKSGEYLHYVKSLLLDGHGLGSVAATRRLVEKMREVRPDVVQIHILHDYYINYRVFFEYLNATDIPVVWTFHDCWAFTGHCAHFVTADCKHWQTGCHDCPLLGEYPRSLFVDRSHRNYALKQQLFGANRHLHIVAVSEWIEQLCRQSFFGQKNIRVIHNGTDLSTFRPSKTSPHQRFNILGVSTVWRRDKGLDDFCKLRKILPCEHYSITLVGLTEKQRRDLPYGISGITRTNSQEEMVRLYNEADVLLNMTYADTFPTVNLEALACGKPVITYRTGGSPEAIDDSTGTVVEQGNVAAAAEAVKAMRARLATDADMSRRCRERAERLYDKDRCFEQYIDLYNELLYDKAHSLQS